MNLFWTVFLVGAGKTYTMLGRDDHPGIMAQALTELFYEMAKNGEELTYKVNMSYLEVGKWFLIYRFMTSKPL